MTYSTDKGNRWSEAEPDSELSEVVLTRKFVSGRQTARLGTR
jgi:hypothetical protein